MSIVQNLFRRKYLLEEVFTPTSAARLTYVHRKDLDTDLKRSLAIPGMQLILYGYSGGGKTTLIDNELRTANRRSISTLCTSVSTVEQLLLLAFDKLEIFYTSRLARKDVHGTGMGLSAKYLSLRDEISRERTAEQTRAVPVQINAQRLAEFLGNSKCIWVIEDFHKVAPQEKKKLSEMLKTFVDVANQYSLTKVICIGAVGTAREVVECDKELSNRVAELFVPLLSKDELLQIIAKGSGLLNVIFEADTVDRIVRCSNNLAAICHQLCYNLCEAGGAKTTLRHAGEIAPDKFDEALAAFVRQSSDTFTKALDSALKQRDGETHNARLVLQAMIDLQEESLSHNQIVKKIRHRYPKYSAGSVITCVRLLTNPAYGEVLRYDSNAGKYSFVSPFLKAFIMMKFESERERKEGKRQSAPKLSDLRFDLKTYNDILTRLLRDQYEHRKAQGA